MLPSRSTILALLDTVAMPFVLLGMGITSCGCVAWFALIATLVLMGARFESGGIELAILAWTLVAGSLGVWNFGRFIAYFSDAEGKLTGLVKVVGTSAAIVATNPLLWYWWVS